MIVQILSHGGRIYALDSEGKIWTREVHEGTGTYRWIEVPGPEPVGSTDTEFYCGQTK